MFPDFAYSSTMQVILFFISTLTIIIFYIYTTDLILTLYGEKVSLKRRIIFILLTSIVLNQFWIYGIYVIGGYSDFSILRYALVIMPNPFFLIICYFLGIKVLKLSKYHSINLMKLVYHYIILMTALNQFINANFFLQTEARYNYMLDAISVVIYTIVYTIIFIIFKIFFKFSHFFFRLPFKNSKPSKSPIIELGIGFLIASIIYAFVVVMPFWVEPRSFAFFYIVLVLSIAFVLNVLISFNLNARTNLENKDAYIKKLTTTIEDFAGLKHDINNILQTYGGYLSIGDMDKLKKYHKSLTIYTAENQVNFEQKMAQNPLLAILLISKTSITKERNIKLTINIDCDIKEMYINNESLCFVLSDLFDYMIDLISDKKNKNLFFSINDDNNKKNIKLKIYMLEGNKNTQLDKANLIMQDYLYKYNNVKCYSSYRKNEFVVLIELFPSNLSLNK